MRHKSAILSWVLSFGVRGSFTRSHQKRATKPGHGGPDISVARFVDFETASPALAEACLQEPPPMPLTDTQIRSLKPESRPYNRADADGLYIEVRPTGAKLWRYKYGFMGKGNRIALGPYPEVSLAEARRQRDEARRKLREGIDPLAERKHEKLVAQYKAANTFGEFK
jgi:hypothetical protein